MSTTPPTPTPAPAPAAPPDRVILSRRTLSATPEQIFAAFADPQRLAQWWGPNGFTNIFSAFDFHPGGHWVFIMRGPDGTEYPNESKFIELTPPTRIVLEHLRTMHWFRLTIDLLAQPDARTEISWHMEFATAEEVARIRPFISDANQQNFDRLAAHLAASR